MKGTTLTTAPAEVTEAPVEEKKLSFQNEGHKMQFDMLADLINKRNKVVKALNAASGDRPSIETDIRENSDDPEIVRLREAIAEAEAQLSALVTPLVEERITASSGSTEELEKALKDIDGTLKPGSTFFKKLYDDGSYDFLPTAERLKGTTVRSGSSGGRRIRGFNVIVEIDGETKEFENFTTAAKHLDVDTVDLQNAFFQKAGTQDLKAVPNVVNMVIEFDETDSDGNITKKEAIVKAYRTEATDDAPATDDGSPEPTQVEANPEPAAEEVNLEDL